MLTKARLQAEPVRAPRAIPVRHSTEAGVGVLCNPVRTARAERVGREVFPSRLCRSILFGWRAARQPCEEKLLRFSLIPTQKSTRPMERRRGGVEGGAGAATEATCCPSPAP